MRQKKLNAAGPDSDRRNFEGKKDVFSTKIRFLPLFRRKRKLAGLNSIRKCKKKVSFRKIR
jgi:hypothetical protein